ncbi:unnamed protein product [Bursaphelenchus okinawaensis]|uniref:Galectin n=1 Tax=Bursaphelenchus okinawaensis TaxID=465554 RepID=A0A811KTF0_9BILA|nr:unnamed protein product [Bursaphelenchus okinawaensis]CAG9111504.1 unnamed protein product [Bursaphelenchus okinawaensis]
MGEVRNVSVPYAQNINNGLPSHATIEVEGDVIVGHEKAIWLEFRGQGNEIPLHINIRFGSVNGSNEICVNSFDRDWGREDFYKQSVTIGGSIYAKIVIRDDRYEVDINGREFVFKHRTPKYNVTRFEVRGDIRVARINYTGFGDHIYTAGQYPSPYPQPSQPSYPPNPYPNPGYPENSRPGFPDNRPNYPNPSYPDPMRPYPSDPGYQPPYNPDHRGDVPIGQGAQIGQNINQGYDPFRPHDSRGYN